jgi:hypothetical protein
MRGVKRDRAEGDRRRDGGAGGETGITRDAVEVGWREEEEVRKEGDGMGRLTKSC